jgi:hypothetical protein
MAVASSGAFVLARTVPLSKLKANTIDATTHKEVKARFLHE